MKNSKLLEYRYRVFYKNKAHSPEKKWSHVAQEKFDSLANQMHELFFGQWKLEKHPVYKLIAVYKKSCTLSYNIPLQKLIVYLLQPFGLNNDCNFRFFRCGYSREKAVVHGLIIQRSIFQRHFIIWIGADATFLFNFAEAHSMANSDCESGAMASFNLLSTLVPSSTFTSDGCYTNIVLNN